MGMLDTVLHLATRFVQRCAWLSKVEETDGVRSSGIENTGCAVSWIEYSNGNASCCSVSFPVHKAPVRSNDEEGPYQLPSVVSFKVTANLSELESTVRQSMAILDAQRTVRL